MKRILLTGNHAVAWGARLARPKVVPVYPITPQTPVMELLTEFQAAGEFDAEILTPESEHSVMAACIPASLAGVRVFTATASQGLALMHEVLHYAAGARAPIVMAHVNRTNATPGAVWAPRTLEAEPRGRGWIQLYVESAQEALDSVIQAFRIAERVLLPTMVNLDAFYVSHALEPVTLPPQEIVDDYLPPYAPEHFLDPERGESWGNVVSQDMYYRHRREIGAAMDRVPALAAEADREWYARPGRRGGVSERDRCEDAELILGTMGRMCGTARDAVDALRDTGFPAGLLKVRLFRPLPAAELRAALQDVRDVVVLDRNFSPGVGGVLHQELRAALYGMKNAPRIHGYLAGVGGVNVSPQRIMHFARQARAADAEPEPVWVR